MCRILRNSSYLFSPTLQITCKTMSHGHGHGITSMSVQRHEAWSGISKNGCSWSRGSHGHAHDGCAWTIFVTDLNEFTVTLTTSDQNHVLTIWTELQACLGSPFAQRNRSGRESFMGFHSHGHGNGHGHGYQTATQIMRPTPPLEYRIPARNSLYREPAESGEHVDCERMADSYAKPGLTRSGAARIWLRRAWCLYSDGQRSTRCWLLWRSLSGTISWF